MFKYLLFTLFISFNCYAIGIEGCLPSQRPFMTEKIKLPTGWLIGICYRETCEYPKGCNYVYIFDRNHEWKGENPLN